MSTKATGDFFVNTIPDGTELTPKANRRSRGFAFLRPFCLAWGGAGKEGHNAPQGTRIKHFLVTARNPTPGPLHQ